MFQAAKLVIERGVSFGIVIRLFFYRLPQVMILTLPMSSLLAALLGMSSLAGGSELIALKSLGVPFKRILRPIILASFCVSIAAISLNETLVPFTSMAADRLMRYEIMKNQTAAVQEKVFLRNEEHGKLKRVLYIDRMDTKKGLMSGVIIHEFEDGRMVRTLTAQRGLWQGENNKNKNAGQWWIEDGRFYDVNKDGEVKLLLKFERQKLALNLSPEQLERSTRRPSDMSANELWLYIRQADALGTAGKDLSKLWVMFHLKLAVPWACVIMAVLGAGFGAMQKGRGRSGVGFGISVVIVFAYYVVMSMCRALGEAGTMPAILAGWMPNFIFFAVALFFAHRVDKI